MLIWICGPSGAGKSTIGRALYEHLKPSMPNLFLIDGDDFREAMGNDLGYTPEDRRKNGHRIAGMSRLLNQQGISVICCASTIHPEVQKYNHTNFPEYCEVMLNVSFETLLRRDTKNIYAKALDGKMADVVGVDIKLDTLAAPHLVLDNDGDCTDFSVFVEAIISQIHNKRQNSKVGSYANATDKGGVRVGR